MSGRICSHRIDMKSMSLDENAVDMRCILCGLSGSIIVLPEDVLWDDDASHYDDDEPRRYESVPSFVEDEPIPFVPTPKANRAVRD